MTLGQLLVKLEYQASIHGRDIEVWIENDENCENHFAIDGVVEGAFIGYGMFERVILIEPAYPLEVAK